MVLASICEHASTAFYFANTSNDQICLASSEHFVNFPLKFTAIPAFYLNVRLFFYCCNLTEMRSWVRFY